MVTVTPQDIERVVTDITTNVLIERTAAMWVLVRGALAGVNINQEGPPGSGKSLMCRALCERITGARFFQKTLHAQMPADALIGGYDMQKFAATGVFERHVDGYLPMAHVGLLDEWPRANGPTLDSFLPMLNVGERMAEGNGGMFKTPLLFIVLASNFKPEADDPQFGALIDRITLNQYLDYVAADASFHQSLITDHARQQAVRAGAVQKETVTLEQFERAQQEVREVALSPEFLQAYSQLRRNARIEGMPISDRAFVELSYVAKAEAWLAGRTVLQPSDIAAIENGLWRDKDDRGKARQLVKGFLSPLIQEADDRRSEADPHLAMLLELRPVVEGVPLGAALDSGVMSQAQSVSRALGAANLRVEQLMEQAQREQVQIPELTDLHDELQSAKKWLETWQLPAYWPKG